MADRNITVLIKEPYESVGHLNIIDTDYKTIQEIVGGYFEMLYVRPDVVMLVNEEGKVFDLDDNFIYEGADYIKGTAIICGISGEEITDLPISKEAWMEILKKWGNKI